MKFKYSNGCLKISECVNFIIDSYIKSNANEIIIVNIGTDKCTGDCFGPLLGSLLEENTNLDIYGTLEYPIHALNLKRELTFIKHIHPNAFIIATDACLGNGVDEIHLRDLPIRPGAGVEKNLQEIGDLSFAYIVGNKEDSSFFASINYRIGLAYKAAKQICNVINEVERKLECIKNKEMEMVL